jgi:DNA polymerase-3 subunit alpha
MNFSDYKPYKTPYPVGLRLPKIKIEDKYYKQLSLDKDASNFDFLKALCRKGIKDLGIDKKENKKEYYDRTLFELNLIEELSFTDYMLLNWEVLNFCKEKAIPTGAGRGSAASSLVLFLTGVTKIDPI